MLTFAELDRVEKTYGLPDYVKSASSEPDVIVPASAYADPIKRKFPCHTKAACFMSNANFWENAIQDDNASEAVGKQLMKFANYWGITKDVHGILIKVASQPVANNPDALPDSAFGLIHVDSISGQRERMFPIVDSQSTKAAAAQFYKYRDRLPLDQRRKVAAHIYKNACDFNVEIEDEAVADYVERAAGRGLSPVKTIHHEMMKRAAILKTRKQTPVSETLKQAAASILKQRPSRELSAKTAQMLDTLDQQTGLYKLYGTDLPFPEEVCCQVLYKHASAELDNYVLMPSGHTWSKDDMCKQAGAWAILPDSASSDLKLRSGCITRTSLDKSMQKLSTSQKHMLEDALFALDTVPVTLPIDLREFQ